MKLSPVVALLAFNLVGCGVLDKKDDDSPGGGGSSGPGADTAAFETNLQGSWNTPCKDTSTDESKRSSIDSISVKDGILLVTSTVHDDSTCVAASVAVAISGKIVKITHVEGTEDRHFVQIDNRKIQLKPKSAKSVSSFNIIKMCGFTDWKLDEAKEVRPTMKNCVQVDDSETEGTAHGLIASISESTLSVYGGKEAKTVSAQYKK